MILTLYYMYATFLQWFRLGALKNKLTGTLNSQNALLVCQEAVIYDSKKQRSLENLLFKRGTRIGCTIVPKQKINLSAHWVNFPKDHKYFPIFFRHRRPKISSPHIYVLIEAVLEVYNKHDSETLQMENFGELVAWKVTDNFEAILKTDMDKLTILMHCFSQNDCDMNHDLQLLKIETVEIEGKVKRIKFEKQFSIDTRLKYSLLPIHWRKFVSDVRDVYSKVRDATNPKITIENGTNKIEEIKKVPVSEVKPIKKDKRSEDKHTLEVSSTDYRRHKDHKKDKDKKDKEKNQHSKKEEKNIPDEDTSKTKESLELKAKDNKHHKGHIKDKFSSPSKSKEHHKEDHSLQGDDNTKTSENVEHKTKNHIHHKHHGKENSSASGKTKEHHHHRKDIKLCINIVKDVVDGSKGTTQVETEDSVSNPEVNVKTDSPKHEKDHKSKDKEHKSRKHEKGSTSKPELNEKPEASTEKGSKKHKTEVCRSGSKDKKLVKSTAVTEPPDEDYASGLASKENHKHKSKPEDLITQWKVSEANGLTDSSADISGMKFKNVKPPNILVYADSVLAKDNVKATLANILNREKYTIYDLPINQNTWSDSTVLVVICGTVPASLVFHLLQYLLNGGQLFCLCSDFLYSVLHTFTTAEVREHELVRFSYGKWQKVKMMHHIFCYQASPAKKQFSKDSDASNHSSGNGSSPVAPRTPSTANIQHNGKEYTIQVQVLGTEETWETPSLLLATVKDCEGRAVFSQVHLEINPDQYEDDENKYEALKESDGARLEILKDILSIHLELDCDSPPSATYSPAYFLGRHDLKIKALSECDSIKDKRLLAGNLNVVFCGKDDVYDSPSTSYLPVLIHACPSNFSTVNYFETLETEHIGRLVLYSDVLTSSQVIIDNKRIVHGLVVIPRQQTGGVGRSNNSWISPAGSASFSLQLHVPVDSHLGRTLPIIQHLIMVSIVSAIRKLVGSEGINVGIKWPNDLYANGSTKIGGIVVKSFTSDNLVVVNIGCGINLDNSNPTTCINDLIKNYNLTNEKKVKTIEYEKYFARVFNEIDKLIKIYQNGDVDYLFDLYYRYWLHNDCKITIASSTGATQEVKIVGIDDYGFLKVVDYNGSSITVQPDGNTFDMMKGLISPKSF